MIGYSGIYSPNNKKNQDIIKDFIESFLNIEIQKIELNPYLKSKEKYLPSEEKFGSRAEDP